MDVDVVSPSTPVLIAFELVFLFEAAAFWALLHSIGRAPEGFEDEISFHFMTEPGPEIPRAVCQEPGR